MNTRLSADYLIIGSGIAGLRAAVALQTRGRVLLLTKSDPGAGSTGFAQGGIAAAVGPDDSPDLHFADTIAAGDGLCDPAAVRVLVDEGPRFVGELETWGAVFDCRPDGALDLAREGAHSVRRVLHAHDATGREIARVLAARLMGEPHVTVIDHALAIQALVEDGRVAGVRFKDAGGEIGEARARATLIATGGAGQVFRETTNPPVATGDGVTLAYLAGARIADMEFVQFHPTALAVPGEPRYLLSEALRGEGARLVNVQGDAFMTREDPLGDLAPRDRVARAIARESERTGAPVYLTLAHLPAAAIRARFPLIADLCRRVGMDLATDRLPVSPAAHYVMGGVVTDRDGRTSIPGLYAAGEAACTGVHGANRLASNSLARGPGVRRAGRRGHACRWVCRRMGRGRRSAIRRPGAVGRAGAGTARGRSAGGSHVARRRRVPRRRQPASGPGRHRAGLVRSGGGDRPRLFRVAGPLAHAKPGGRRAPHRAGGAAARGKPRQPLAARFPGKRRSTLEATRDRVQSPESIVQRPICYLLLVSCYLLVVSCYLPEYPDG